MIGFPLLIAMFPFPPPQPYSVPAGPNAPLIAPLFYRDTTSYCLRGRMSNGLLTHRRAAASNEFRLGTKIRIKGWPAGPRGIRRYIISDHIGWGTQLDLWAESCGTSLRWGRHTIRFKLGWAR